MEPEPSRDGGSDLQFDTVEPSTSRAPPALGCGRCKKAVVETYFEVDGQVTCDACYRALGVGWRRGTPGKLVRALVFGAGAALAGGLVYGVVSAVTGYHLALLSIGVGLFVGYAVRHATAGKGGRLYQLLAALLTYLAIAGSYVPDVAKGLLSMADPAAETAEGASPAAGAATPTRAAPGEASPEPGAATPAPVAASTAPAVDPPPSLGRALLGLVLFGVVVIVLSLFGPILILLDSVGSGMLEILIVGFGVWRAWRMNAAAVPVVAGPFSVLAAAAAPDVAAPATDVGADPDVDAPGAAADDGSR